MSFGKPPNPLIHPTDNPVHVDYNIQRLESQMRGEVGIIHPCGCVLNRLTKKLSYRCEHHKAASTDE